MSLDTSRTTEPAPISADTPGDDAIAEARRQIEICNACRYCEGYCAVFPAMTRNRAFADGDITHLANLCHNCRGCYYACQYTEPHEFAINIPSALAEVRADSWERYAWPQPLAQRFQRDGLAIALAFTLGFAVLFALVRALPPAGGDGFYAYMSHNLMVAIFLPAFVLPLVSLGWSLRRYWQDTGGGRITLTDIRLAIDDVARMRNLGGGQGQGCNFERGDRFSNWRRYWHQAVLVGFLLCFAATSSATIMHYLLDWPAPYGFWTPPKLLGVPGGTLMVVGSLGLAALKFRADSALGAERYKGGEIGFLFLVFFTAFSGLALYAASGTGLVSPLLALHLGAVLAFFLLTPYTKMVHGFYRLAALLHEAKARRSRTKDASTVNSAKAQRT